MLSTRDTSRHWIVASMTRGARRTAMALSALTLAVTLAFVGTLYEIKSNPTMPQTSRDAIALAQSATTSDGTELIIDDAVPLAASPARQQTLPTTLVLGFALVAAGGFFAVRIHQVDANISSMRRTVC